MRILVVDDNEANRKLLRLLLVHEGHQVEEAEDGVAGLEKLRAGSFDAIITDILMPRMDGYQFCFEARHLTGVENVPILIHSATYTTDFDENVAISIGADRFLKRPSSGAEVLAALAEMVENPTPRGGPPPLSGVRVLKQYSEGLVRKLEERNVELEESTRQLADAVERLRETRSELHDLVAFAPLGIARTTSEGRVLSANATLVAMLGYAAEEEVLALDLTRAVYANTPDRQALLELFRHEGVVRGVETTLVRKNGERIAVQADVRSVKAEGGEPRRFEIFLRDVTAKKRAEESVRKFLLAVEQAENVIFMSDPSGKITYVNPAFEKTYGFPKEEAIGAYPRILKSGRHDGAFYTALWRALLSGDGFRGEIVNRARDGRLVTVDTSAREVFDSDGETMGFIAVQHDVTERRRLEEQFRQAQKMESIGRLAGGVAHDFNNLLTAILGYSELLEAREPLGAAAREDLKEIRTAAERAAALTRQLLAFSRKQVLAPTVLNPNELVAGIERMLHRLIGEDVNLSAHLDPAVGSIRVDAGQLEQVLVNLAVNARDAMPDGGKLTIETANAVIDTADAAQQVDVSPGRYVTLAVSDTGMGMSDETRSQIFEPFFTTKERGKGTGLGLATVYGIVRQSGGHISVDSEPGSGSTFKLYFPLVEARDTPRLDASALGIPRSRAAL